MTPEVALLVRAALLGLVVLALDHLSERRKLRRAERLRTVVRLPATINPVVYTAPAKPVQVNPAQLTSRHVTSNLQPAHLAEVVRLEPQGATKHVFDKRAA